MNNFIQTFLGTFIANLITLIIVSVLIVVFAVPYIEKKQEFIDNEVSTIKITISTASSLLHDAIKGFKLFGKSTN